MFTKAGLPKITTVVLRHASSAERSRTAGSLELARRLDWRFLLPDTALDDVLYLGPAPSMLLESLRHAAAMLTVVRCEAPQSLQMRPHRVVVAIQPSADTLRQAAGCVAPGGCLYVEACRRVRPRQLRTVIGQFIAHRFPLWRPGGYLAALRRLGFVDIAAYWHWPNFDACGEIIPLGDATAAAHALSRHSGGVDQRVKAALGRGLLHAGLLAWLVPCFSIVACKRQRNAE